ncbi:MAG: hypothetical protein AAF685_10670 [Cyanobacteria bacterium P01_C01_bin.89]
MVETVLLLPYRFGFRRGIIKYLNRATHFREVGIFCRYLTAILNGFNTIYHATARHV